MEEILTECGCYAEGKLYWFAAHCNALLSFDMTTGESTFLGSVPWEKGDAFALYNKIHYYDGRLILTPFFSKHICSYDLGTRKFHQDDAVIQFSNSVMGSDGVIYGGAFDRLYDMGLIAYDIKSGLLREIAAVRDLVKAQVVRPDIIADLSFTENELCFCFFKDSQYISYHVAEDRAEAHAISGMQHGFAATYCPEGIFVSDYDSTRAVLLSPSGDLLEEYVWEVRIEQEEERFHRLLYRDGCLYLNYVYKNENFEIDLREKHGEVRRLEKLDGRGVIVLTDDDLVKLPDYESRRICALHGDDRAFSSEKVMSMILAGIYKEKQIIANESECAGLDTFMKSLL